MHAAAVLHDTGWGHPEHQGRLRAVASAVKNDLVALHGRVEQVAPDAAREEDLRLVHTDALIDQVSGAVRTARERGRVGSLDPDTRISGASWEAALGTVGAGLEAANGVAEGRFRNAFVAARPPGHHATPERAMGFCLFNNIAIAAAALRARGLARRVLIVDWDVHHGNGTQDAFYDDPAVFFLSLHQYPPLPGHGCCGRDRERRRGGLHAERAPGAGHAAAGLPRGLPAGSRDGGGPKYVRRTSSWFRPVSTCSRATRWGASFSNPGTSTG